MGSYFYINGFKNKTKYNYNQLGFLGSVTDAEGNEWKYTYDEFGNLIKVTDAEVK